jgi:ABC-2 type transport system ATP-binding protein
MGVMKYAIEVSKLTKKFNGFTAVNSISFNVKEGEIFGLLGPNGAGKTTTINMLSTLLNLTSGKAHVAGYDVTMHRNEVRKSIGIVFQEPALDGKLTGRENLEFHAMMYNLGKEEMKKKIDEVLDLVDLKDKENVWVEKYSGGMKRRLEIARGLIHSPKVLFLDEPTLGLDAQTRRYIWDYIKKLNEEKKITIILTTHYMEEADFLCNRIAIIDKGKIVVLDTPNKLKDLLGGDIVTLEVEGDIHTFVKHLKSLGYIKKIKEHDGDNKHLSLTMEKGEKKIPEIITVAQKAEVNILSVNLHKPSLEDVFLYFTGKTIREHEASESDIGKNNMRMRMSH